MPRKDLSSNSAAAPGEGEPEAAPDKPAKVSTPSPSPSKVDKVAVATKHPGVFMETAEMEKETGKKLPVGIELKEMSPQDRKGKAPSSSSHPQGSPDRARGHRGAGEAMEVDKEKEEEGAQEAKKEPEEEKAAEVSSSEVEVSVGNSTSPPGKESRVTRGSRRSTRRAEKRPPRDEEADAAVKEEVAANSGATTTEGETSEAESEASVARAGGGGGGDNDSVASGSTLTTRSSSRNKGKDLTVTAAALGGGEAASVPSSNEGEVKKGSSSVASGKVKATKNRGGNLNGAKGKSRRHIFKKSVSNLFLLLVMWLITEAAFCYSFQASKAPASVARTVTSNRVFENVGVVVLN